MKPSGQEDKADRRISVIDSALSAVEQAVEPPANLFSLRAAAVVYYTAAHSFSRKALRYRLLAK